MAIFGSVTTIRAQLGDLPRFRAAFAYLEDVFRTGSPAALRLARAKSGQTERIDLADGAFALEQVYQTRMRAESFFESHRAYIDVQVIVAGEEIIEVSDIAGLSLREDRTPAQDLLFYERIDRASSIHLRTGEAAVLYPVDGHMPGQIVGQPAEVRKTVIKVPVG